MFVDFIIR